MEYNGKAILVIGVSSGIGPTTPLALARYNNTIIITA
jgi:hypothetical protein